MRRYALAGVRHYRIYNLRIRRLEEYELGLDGYQLTGTYGPGDIFRPVLFPGLEIPIDEV